MAALCSAVAASGWSDVLFLDDGTIIIGTIIGTDSEGARYLAYEREIKLASKNIRRSEADLKVLEGLPLVVELMDGSILRGAIADYDPEIGVFLDISFGVLTVPNQSIKSIVDPARRLRYAGSSFLARAGASLYLPILDSAKRFGPDFSIDLAAEWAIPFVRGLTAGFDARYSFVDFKSTGNAEYSFISVSPEVSYRLLSLHTREDWLNSFVPFVSVGAGPVYISSEDSTGSFSHLAELDFGLNAKIGLDIELSQGWGIRAQGRSDLYFQDGDPFISLSVGLLASYDR